MAEFCPYLGGHSPFSLPVCHPASSPFCAADRAQAQQHAPSTLFCGLVLPLLFPYAVILNYILSSSVLAESLWIFCTMQREYPLFHQVISLAQGGVRDNPASSSSQKASHAPPLPKEFLRLVSLPKHQTHPIISIPASFHT